MPVYCRVFACSSSWRAFAGSDFHGSAQFWRRPARVPPLPDYLEPVWSEWS